MIVKAADQPCHRLCRSQSDETATLACPIVTGIHARIVAGAAGEDEAEGKKRITPYWRTLKAGGELNAKYPGGLVLQRQRLEEEGLKVFARGSRLFVDNYEKHLIEFAQLRTISPHCCQC